MVILHVHNSCQRCCTVAWQIYPWLALAFGHASLGDSSRNASSAIVANLVLVVAHLQKVGIDCGSLLLFKTVDVPTGGIPPQYILCTYSKSLRAIVLLANLSSWHF